jgi:hypothetical protein
VKDGGYADTGHDRRSGDQLLWRDDCCDRRRRPRGLRPELTPAYQGDEREDDDIALLGLTNSPNAAPHVETDTRIIGIRPITAIDLVAHENSRCGTCRVIRVGLAGRHGAGRPRNLSRRDEAVPSSVPNLEPDGALIAIGITRHRTRL